MSHGNFKDLYMEIEPYSSRSSANPTAVGLYSLESPPTGYTVTSPTGTSIVQKNEQRPVFILPGFQSTFDEQPSRPPTPYSAPVIHEIDSDNENTFINQRSKTFFVFPSTQQSMPTNHSFVDSLQHNAQLQRPDGICLLRSISFTTKHVPTTTANQKITSLQESDRHMSLSMPQLYSSLSQYVPSTSLPYDYAEESDEFSDSGLTDVESVGYVKHPTWSWRNKFGFFVLSICQALGLSNVWRFPYFCYINGGGSFLLAYLILLIACGTPFLCMEFAVGQLTQDHAISALTKICPLMKGVGFAGIMTSFWLTTCYSVLIAWSTFYLFNSLYSTPRWTSCNHGWNTASCHAKPGSPHGFPQKASAVVMVHSDIGVTATSFINATYSQAPTILTSTDFATSTVWHKIAHSSGTATPLVGTNLTLPSEEFFSNKLLEVSKGVNDLGELRFELLAVIIFVWVFIFVALRKPNILVGHTRYILAIFPHILLLIFAIRSLLLDGAFKGVRYFFKPTWEDLQNIKVWLYALAQTFHSLGVVLGFGIAVGSCNKLNNNIMRDTVVFLAANVYTQIIVSIAVFATIGHIAFIWHRPLENAVSHDPGLVFVVFSEIVSGMPVPTLWALLFFVMLIGVAIDSQVFLMQTIISALKESFRNAIKKYFHGHLLFTLFLCVASLFCSILFVTQAGIYFFQLADHYISVLSILLLAFVEMVTVSWIYGAGKLSSVIYQTVNKKPSFYFIFSWYLLGPLTILSCLITFMVAGRDVKIHQTYVYPSWGYLIGWIMVSTSVCFLPIFALAAYRKPPRTSTFNHLNKTPSHDARQAICDSQILYSLKDSSAFRKLNHSDDRRGEAESNC